MVRRFAPNSDYQDEDAALREPNAAGHGGSTRLKALNQFRLAALRVIVAAIVLVAGICAFVSASSLPATGHTGQALALQASLHPKDASAHVQALLAQAKWPHFANGRYEASYAAFAARRPMATADGNAQPILINEAVQTFDVFAPPPSFAPTSGPLTPLDYTPVWTADENFILFSSNRAGDGHFHIFAIPAQGGAAIQLTKGNGDEYYPTLNKNNSILGFTSNANSGTQDLYIVGGQTNVPFNIGAISTGQEAPIDPATLANNTASALTLGDSNIFTNVTRPSLSPNGDQVVFSAKTVSSVGGHTAGVAHIYYLYVATRGYDSTQSTPPAQLTDGPATDTDPAWSPKGDFIVFASNANSAGFANSGSPLGAAGAPAMSSGAVANRGLFLISAGTTTSVGLVPVPLTGAGGRVSLAGNDDFGPAWSVDSYNQYTNPNANVEYIAFARSADPSKAHDIYYFPLTTNNTDGSITISAESAGNAPVKLNTDDNANETSATGNIYDDAYPTWAPFSSIFSIAYQSPRSITYNTSANLPLEVAQSLGRGTTGYGAQAGTAYVGAAYMGILESQVLNLDPPTLLRDNGDQVIQITDENGVQPSGRFIQAGRPVTFTVRLSNREAGNDDNNIYLQIKDPDSKYQDSQGIEHKIFARSNENPSPDMNFNPGLGGLKQAPNPFDYRHDSGSAAARLFNAGTEHDPYAGQKYRGYNFINNTYYYQYGSVGGADGGDTISVGHTADNPMVSQPQDYFPWGPEYECQYVNPTVANPGVLAGRTSALGDYGTPYYLAGFDDQVAFSGSNNPPRPTTNTPAVTDPGTGKVTSATYAEWLKLTRVPDPKHQGGVLYTATWTTPAATSDYYLDVIAYDNAKFPAIASPELTNHPYPPFYVGHSKNWRIYDNVGGFTTQPFDGSNDILVVSDYALGQKFAATTFGGQNGNANLQPTFYGAESYYTDVDVSLLPNAVDYWATKNPPNPPAIPAQANTAAPTNVEATSGTASAVLTWSGNFQPKYNIYRTTNINAVFGAGSTDYTNVATVTIANPAGPGPVATTYTDTGLANDTVYYYVITSVSANNNESSPSPAPSPGNPGVPVTPQDYTGTSHFVQRLALPGFGRHNTFPNVWNGLGVGSYLDLTNDDVGRTDATGANLPDQGGVVVENVPNVRSQKYSLWRILCRGPITSSVLAGYQPTFQSQPAVTDPVNGVSAPAEANVPVAQRCVIWVAPYSGELPLVDYGSIENPTTQDTLAGFLNAGGRLCVTGANVAAALSLNGTQDPNIPGNSAAFLSTYLGAKFATPDQGGQVLGGSGARISGYCGFNHPTLNGEFYPLLNSSGVVTSAPPASQGSLLLGNNFEDVPNWRTDASLDQLGNRIDYSLTNPQGASPIYGARAPVQVKAQINTITANQGNTTDMTTNAATGLIYHEDYADKLQAGYGSRVVFGSFGLEGVSIDYYKTTINSVDYYTPRNQRPNILHNIVSYLRTGTFNIHVSQASGQNVAGATVYLKPDGGTLPGPRQLFSVNDPGGINTSGNYVISGVEPGSYRVVAYKSGFSTTISNTAFTVEGDTSYSTGLVISPVPPGRILGTVKDNAGNPVAGVTVSFKATDGQINYTATTAPDGTYKIDPAAAGSYIGTASKKPQYTDAAAPTQGNPVVVQSGGTSQADFILQAQPASVSGTVFVDTNGDGVLNNGEKGVPGAVVTFTPANGSPVTTTTNGSGNYSFTNLAPGTYKITVAANGYKAAGGQTITIQPGDVLTGKNIPVIVVPPTPPGYIGGMITDAYTGLPLANVTVTVTDSTGKQVGNQVSSTASTSSATSPKGDGQPVNYGPIALQPGQYTVTVTLAGFGTESLSNLTVQSNSFTRADFNSANGNPLQPMHVFGSGYSFFSTPYDYAAAGVSINTIFGSLNTGTSASPSPGSNRSHLFVWSPPLLQYVLDPTPPADGIHLGQGYWVYLQKPAEVTVAGNLPTTTTIPVGLKLGWNMIGVPSLTPISVSRLAFGNAAGGGTISFKDASSSSYHLVSPTLYGYNGTGYVSLTSGGSLQPWQAYWIYAFADTTILLPTGGG